MDNRKYIGMDVHQASISIAVSDAAGKMLIECIIETKAAAVLEFVQGLRGSLWVALSPWFRMHSAARTLTAGGEAGSTITLVSVVAAAPDAC